MQLSLDILSGLARILNVDELKSKITGKVYIGDTPDTSETEDITIKTLSNPNGYVQSGIINLNLYIPQVKAGRANLERFKELLPIISGLVNESQSHIDGDYYYQILEDKGIFKDQERDGIYFNNLRLEFQTI